MKHVGALLTLCGVQLLSLALFVHIYPFIASFLLSLGVEEHDVGTAAGLAESLMSLSNIFATPLWVSLSQRTSRREALLWSLLGAASTSFLLGFATSIWQVLALRAIQGGVQSLGVLSSLIVGDVMEPEHRATAFAWTGSANFAGATIGTILGGMLALPEGRIPVLGRLHLFQLYPYALPGVALAAACALGLAAVLYWVPKSGGKYRPMLEPSGAETASTVVAVSATDNSYRSLLRNPAYVRLILFDFLIKVCMMGCNAIISAAGPLDPALGGFGLPVGAFGRLLAAQELSGLLILFFLFKPIFNRVSNRQLLILVSLGWMSVASFIPIANYLARQGRPNAGMAWWIVTGLFVIGKPIGLLFGPACQVFLISVFPEQDTRPKAVGLSKQVSQCGNFVGSLLFGHLFAISSRHKPGSPGRLIATATTFFVALCLLGLAMTQEQVTELQAVVAEPSNGVDEERRPLLGSERQSQ